MLSRELPKKKIITIYEQYFSQVPGIKSFLWLLTLIQIYLDVTDQ